MKQPLPIALILLLLGAPGYANNLAAKPALETFYNASSRADYVDALNQFRDLHERHPDDPELAYYLGRSLYHQRQLEEADEILSRNIERYPEHVESHYVLGSVKLTRVSEVSVFRKIGMAKAAIGAWEQTVALDPNHVEALYGVVEFYFNAPGMAGGDKALAEAKLAELAQLSKPWADLSRASRAVRAESYQDAEALFKSAIAGIPNRAFPQLMLANAYLQQDKFDDALKALNTYKQRERTWNDPSVTQTELMAARIYQGLGETAQAKQSLRRVLDNEPVDNIREQAEELLASLD